MRWTETAGRLAVIERSQGQCEIHRDHRATDWSHRRARGQGGPWSPTNGLHICHRAHMWLEAEPTLATLGGWRLVHDEREPGTVPVWLALPWPGWWLLTFEDDVGIGGRSHIMLPLVPEEHDLPERPLVMPPEEAVQ